MNRKLFTALPEANILIERWRQEYNHVRIHSDLGYRSPVPSAFMTVAIA
ncbi:integrase core domain-containing protein [Chloroflexota bacterium]